MLTDYNDIALNEKDLHKYKNKNILITGANGLIGGALADFFIFLNDNYNFNIQIQLSSLSTNPERIKDIINREDITYVSTDLSSGDGIIGFFDYCFYCSGYAQPAKFLDKPIETINLNTLGLFNTMKNIYEQNSSARVIFLSSSEVYASSKNSLAHKEDDDIVINQNNKRNFYILGKLGGENVINYFREKGYKATSARVSLCYGPGVLKDDNRVLTELVKKGITQDFIQLYDDGSAVRRYLHISDFIKMIVKISLKGDKSVYNICGEEETTIYDLANLIGKFLGKEVKKGKSVHLVSKTAPKIVWNSLERYNDEFGEINFKSFEHGVKEFITWYSEKFFKKLLT